MSALTLGRSISLRADRRWPPLGGRTGRLRDRLTFSSSAADVESKSGRSTPADLACYLILWSGGKTCRHLGRRGAKCGEYPNCHINIALSRSAIDELRISLRWCAANHGRCLVYMRRVNGSTYWKAIFCCRDVVEVARTAISGGCCEWCPRRERNCATEGLCVCVFVWAVYCV